MMTESTPASTDSLQLEVAALRTGVRWLFSLSIIALAMVNGFIITFAVPKLQHVYAELLPGGVGSESAVTQFEITLAESFPSPQLILFGLTSGVLLIVWRLRSAAKAWGVATAFIVLLTLHWLFSVYACFAPLTTILEALPAP